MALSLSQVGYLLDNLKDFNVILASSAESISSFTYMLSTYAYVVLFISSFCSNTINDNLQN